MAWGRAMQHKTISAAITKGKDNNGTFVLTSTALDRDGDVITESAR
jgi:hypothetical protein